MLKLQDRGAEAEYMQGSRTNCILLYVKFITSKSSFFNVRLEIQTA
jgi:hypothetical protein